MQKKHVAELSSESNMELLSIKMFLFQTGAFDLFW